ncbi:allatostatin-A receptor-like isoform X1 [Leptopilina heterotoma]|uniref:allatostatin-A receptor-like isoform X1 n=1 Tax=Leptopilina heterotoma TaxID=63436 RepID=UPI001CA810F6|nr:allatostatin-A receptor-like isoform X1 [Leptopilina heterotoma]XP_043471912.1 allatostatin-A receptor-like isoform X1 [Leptopilina heterotoma]XP_043471913.1 allatostatin-A receptor-like isoform X1 [Leptopilina heterotoma]
MDGLWNSSHSSNTANITSVICNSTTNRGICVKEEDSSFDRELVEQIVAIVVPLFFGLIGVLGLVGNSLVVLVVAANPGMRSTTNILIINLAVADLLFVLFCVPFTATDYVLPFWPFGNIWCKVVQYLIIVTACASVYTLVLMSLDRYLAVVHPIASMSVRTETHAFIAICILWAVILTVSIPALIIHGEIHFILQEMDISSSENLTACRILPQFNWPLFQVSFFLSSYVVPLTLIIGLYICMLLRLWRGSRISAESRRGRKRVTRLVVVVVGVFAFCWLPIQLILVIKSVDKYPLTTPTIMLQIASHVLAYTNSCVNPFLYAFLSENFRKAFRKIIYCKSRLDPHHRLGPPTRTTRAASTDAGLQITISTTVGNIKDSHIL